METAVLKPLFSNEESKEKELILTSRFEEALVFATQLHEKQRRRTTGAPYVSHLMGVTSIVMNMPHVTEDEIIAALLHDAVEDQGEKSREEILKRFGGNVVNLIDECTNPPIDDWRKRKEYAIAQIRRKKLSTPAQHIRLADKIHNAQSLSTEIDIYGKNILSKFSGGQEGTLWYYKSMAEAFKESVDEDLKIWAQELEEIVNGIEKKLA